MIITIILVILSIYLVLGVLAFGLGVASVILAIPIYLLKLCWAIGGIFVKTSPGRIHE